MAKVKIYSKRCKGCMLCIGVCPQGCIIRDANINVLGTAAAKYNGKDCLGCMHCAVICPDFCIEVFKDEAKKNINKRQ